MSARTDFYPHDDGVEMVVFVDGVEVHDFVMDRTTARDIGGFLIAQAQVPGVTDFSRCPKCGFPAPADARDPMTALDDHFDTAHPAAVSS